MNLNIPIVLTFLKKNKTILGIIIILIFLGIGYRTFLLSRMNTISPKLGSIVESVYGLGTIHSEKTYSLKIGITSSIRNIYVKEGQFVTKGQKLLELDSIPIFKAPFSGTIISIPFEPGETVFPQVPLLKMEDLSEIFLKVSFEQQGALRVRKGQSARILFEAIRGSSFEGTVRTIFPDEGQFMVYIDVIGLPSQILPGMTADVAIITGEKEKVLLVPINAIHMGQVIRIREGKKLKVPVKLGAVNGEWAEIIEGDINLNDLILIPNK